MSADGWIEHCKGFNFKVREPACRIASLRNEVGLDHVEEVHVVLLQLAQLDEVERGFGPLLGEQVHGKITHSGFYHHRHCEEN